jgi:hypothetical protein
MISALPSMSSAIKDVVSLPSYESIAGQFAYRPIDLANPIYNGPIVVSKDAARPELLRRYGRVLDQFCEYR